MNNNSLNQDDYEELYIFSFNPKYDKKMMNKFNDIYINCVNVPQDINDIDIQTVFETAIINPDILKQNISDVKIPDKKYFHKTIYADIYYKKFGIVLKPNTLYFNLSYDILSSTIKFYHSLTRYKNNKSERYDDLITILKSCINKYKNSYKESKDLHIIKLYNKMKKMYKLLKDMNKIGKYNFISLEKEIEFEIYLIKYSNILDINHITKQSMNYSNKNTYSIFRYSVYDNGSINYNISLFNLFYKKYNQEINFSQFNFVLDSLTLICNLRKEYDDNKKTSMLKHYFLDYPKLIKTNDDFDDNYRLLKHIIDMLKINKKECLNVLLNTLIQKNIDFFEVDDIR